MNEVVSTFDCFGGRCTVAVSDDAAAVERARERLLGWHAELTRFDAQSALSRLNADPREAVPASPALLGLAIAAAEAGRVTGGLVDATLAGEVEDAGYRGELHAPMPLELALRLAPPRRPGGPSPAAGWAKVAADREAGVIRRPPGVRLDSGGLAKGLLADVLAEELADHAAVAIDCGGDLRMTGSDPVVRDVTVESPFDGAPLHTFRLARAGVATSGIGRRSWLTARGRPAHHLLDPATGQPAFTGVVQATAIAATALEAEVRAKAAVLAGPEAAHAWLPDGGVLVFDDRAHTVLLSA
jgi:thiamine biosynthesis lipoprotein